MKAFVALSALFAVASAGVIPGAIVPGPASAHAPVITPAGHGPSTIVRAPAHDSASIESHRLGGNFAYSTAEAHAFAKTTPILSTVTHPVAETTIVEEAPVLAHIKPASILRTHHAARTVYADHPVIKNEAVIGPVRAHTTVHQPIVKTKTIAQTAVHAAPVAVAHAQPVAAVAAAPAVAAYAQPAAIAAAPAAIGAYAQPALGYGYAAQPALGYAAQPAIAY